MPSTGPRLPEQSVGPLVAAALAGILGLLVGIPPPAQSAVGEQPGQADSTAEAQLRLHPDAALAFRYSPIVHLATDETLHPVIPHAFAFDGIDNDGDHLLDFEDPTELAPGLLDLETTSRLFSPRRPLRATIRRTDLAQSILDHAGNGVLDAWRVPDSTRAALLSAGIELSPRAYLIEPAPDDRPAVVAYIVSPERWLSLDRKVSWDVRAAARRPDGDLPAGRLEGLGIPLVSAHVRWAPHGEAGEGGIYHVTATTSWETGTAFSLYPEPGDQLGVYYGADSTNADVPGIAEFIHARRDTVVRNGLEVAPAVRGAVMYELARAGERLERESPLLLRRLMTPPEPRVGYTTRVEPRTAGHQVGYWLYFLFDIGTGAHIHDAEHAIVYTDALGDVVAFAADAHGEAAAANILLRDRQNVLAYQRPQILPRHMSLLVELGKHALAPDRNDDGRFDIGMDANYVHRSAWGVRDLNTAFGIDAMSEFRSEYSFPRSSRFRLPHRMRFNADRANHPRPPEVEESAPLPWGDDDAGRYSFYPAEDFEHLFELLGDPEADRDSVLSFLARHKACFWGSRANLVELPRRIPDDSWKILSFWPKNEIDRRDFWTHRAYRDPDLVFKPWLYPRVAFIGGIVQQPPYWTFPMSIQFPAPRTPFAVETIRIAVDRNLNKGEFQDLRLMMSTGRGAMRAISTGLGRAGTFDERPRLLFLLEYSPVQVMIPRIGAQRVRLAPIAGVRTAVGSSQTDWRFHLGMQFETSLLGPVSPLPHAPAH